MRIDDVLGLDIPHAEKLVLLYLAHHASSDGVGRWRREHLEHTLGYKRRSVQRLLKSLRDQQLLEDLTEDWYRIGIGRPDLNTAPPDADGFDQDVLEQIGLERRQQYDFDQADELIENLADTLVMNLSNFEHRMNQSIERFVLHVEQSTPVVDPPPAEPEPDPVLEHPLYRQLVDAGAPETTVYELVELEIAKQGLETLEKTPRERIEALLEDEHSAQGDEPADPVTYSDDARGRCQRVADILAGGESRLVTDHEFAVWQRLEALENKHSVKGEEPAFEQLYPAITGAARRNVGMSLADFCNVRAANEGQAPWDQDPNPSTMNDQVLEAEIAVMLDELAQMHDPRCEVQPRTTEKADDGSTIQETIQGYHRRVQAVHQQMQRLKAMGAFQ